MRNFSSSAGITDEAIWAQDKLEPLFGDAIIILGNHFVLAMPDEKIYFLPDFRNSSTRSVTSSSLNRYINKMEKFGSFYKDYQKALFSYLMRMTGDYYLASDIMQESYTRYLENYSQQSPNAAILFTIARNALFDHSRVRGRNLQLEEEPIDGSGNPEYGLMVKQDYQHVLAAMQKLKEDERDILALAISDGISYRDIATITGISLENVKVKVHRIRLKLKKILQEGDQK
jgi:RNA polymerase sigma-70 factor (ECF subfamily)